MGLEVVLWGLLRVRSGSLGWPEPQQLHRSSRLTPWAGNGAAALQFFSDFSVSPGRSPRRKVAFVPARGSPAQPSQEIPLRREGKNRTELANWIRQELQTNRADNSQGVFREGQYPEIPKELPGNDAAPSPA